MIETALMLAWPHSGFYVFFVWLPIYFETIRNNRDDVEPMRYVFPITCGILVLHLLAQLGSGYVSTFTGIHVLLKFFTLLVVAIAIPLFYAFSYGSEAIAYSAFVLIAIIQAPIGACQYAWCVQHFYLWRFTSLGLAYNFATCVFGGTVPVICTAAATLTWLGRATPALWVIVLGMITLSVLYWVGEVKMMFPYDEASSSKVEGSDDAHLISSTRNLGSGEQANDEKIGERSSSASHPA
uniref:Major facilitator superfamily (MFS) profile domain-containing protein n=1 Tax=Lotharella oceanica TaxID=641309 RepID=A0A7S2TUI8_9EUKA|mmetsp:Transcript_30382/g.56772  ORF Transcript_30382/g.56772 Transcript_30382/m.56772 type:complete len:239 (+) Transcript_30382:194-910(+)